MKKQINTTVKRILNIAPQTLGSATVSYYDSEKFFDNKQFKRVMCYYHSSSSGWTFPIRMHEHEFYEINIIISGQGVHYINNERIVTSIGDVFVIKPNSQHGYYALNNMEIFHILLSKEFFDKFDDELNNMDGFISLFSIEPKLRSEKTNNSFLQLNKEQFNSLSLEINKLLQFDDHTNYSNNIQTAIVFQLICRFCRYYNNKNQTNRNNTNSYTQSIIYAMEYMKKNLSNKLSIDDIAKTVFLSKSTFNRYFSLTCNMSPIQYLISLRISEAKKLLVGTEKTITFIANECGFFDTSYFEKHFIKSEGITPSAYRRLRKQK